MITADDMCIIENCVQVKVQSRHSMISWQLCRRLKLSFSWRRLPTWQALGQMMKWILLKSLPARYLR